MNPFLYDEQEPAGDFGSNDVQANAEQIAKFGRGAGKRPAVRIQGELSPPALVDRPAGDRRGPGLDPARDRDRHPSRQRGDCRLERDRRRAVRQRGNRLGRLRLLPRRRDGQSGHPRRPQAATSTPCSWSTTRTARSSPSTTTSRQRSERACCVPRPADGDYYVMVGGYALRPAAGGPVRLRQRPRRRRARAPYDLSAHGRRRSTPTTTPSTSTSGDVLGGRCTGAATRRHGAPRRRARPMVSSDQDASFIYPSQTPAARRRQRRVRLRRRGGRLVHRLDGPAATAPTTMTLEAYRPGGQGPPTARCRRCSSTSTASRVNTGIFGGPGVSTLSPLSRFLGRWGLPTPTQNAGHRRGHRHGQGEHHHRPDRQQGSTTSSRSQVLNSRDNPTPFGQPNVSRVVVGGTIAADRDAAPSASPSPSTRATTRHEESAMVLLDVAERPEPGRRLAQHLHRPPAATR